MELEENKEKENEVSNFRFLQFKLLLALVCVNEQNGCPDSIILVTSSIPYSVVGLLGTLMKLNSRALLKLTVQVSLPDVVTEKKKKSLSIFEIHIQIFPTSEFCFQRRSSSSFQYSSDDGLINKRSKLSYPKQLCYPYVMSY